MEQRVSRLIVANADARSPILKRLAPRLNSLAEALFIRRARHEKIRDRAMTVPRLSSLGIAPADCRELLARGLIAVEGTLKPSSSVVLTRAGLAVLQQAIPAGAVRPVYDASSRELSVAGETILRLAVQARNLAAVLTTVEGAGWASRVENPLNGRPCGNDAHRLAVAANRLNRRQCLIDFHADDGAITWSWRPRRETLSTVPLRPGKAADIKTANRGREV